MAAGDVKGDEVVVRPVVLGATVTKGQVIHLEADTFWDPGAALAVGSKAVAIESGVITDTINAVFWGPVEVTNAAAAAIGIGEQVGAGAAGTVTPNATAGQAFAKAMTPIAISGTGVIWVGLV